MAKVDEILNSLMEELEIKAPLEEFKMGLKVEQEHTSVGPKEGKYKVIPQKLIPIAKIVAAHLAEIPDYYTRLKKMEEEGKKEKKKTAADPKQKSPRMRNTFFNLLGLNSVNKLIDPMMKDDKPEEEKKQNTPEVVDDDFFASVSPVASEIWGEEEEAILPDDVVRKPKDPVTASKSLLPLGLPQLDKLRNQISETLHYIVHKVLPESKENPEQFHSLRELRDNLETSLLSLNETIEKIK